MKKILLLSIVSLIIIPVLINCTSSSNKPEIIEIRDQEGVKHNNISALAPGQVLLQATVIEIIKLESKTDLSILINKVLEYGSATTPIANGSNLTVSVNNDVLTEQVQNNDTIIVIMRNKPIGPGNESNTSWEILRFK